MLKYLELFGFKSFADRTRFDFPQGITCVVGPNGSGKSNVVDAMKWILGDQSPKSLRGKDMLDVIFNGSAGRKASAFAEATLMFNNTQRFLPIESDEVSIGRRLWQSGDSEYLINGSSARLKDIRDAFMGTGAATSAYSIIEQGKVGQILQSNATARRVVFEEAAGISRFKSRKSDALRKLERVSQNLLRLTDIVDQLENQLNSTRNQAAKAAKYREVSKELKASWLGLAADDYRYLTHQLATINGDLGQATERLAEFNEQQAAIETELSSYDSKIGALDDQLREAEQKNASCREAIATEQATVRHETDRLSEMESDLVRLRRQRSNAVMRSRSIADQLNASQGELDEFDKTFQNQQETLRNREQQSQALATAIAEARSALEEQTRAQNQLNDQASTINQDVVLVKAQRESLATTRERLIEQRDRLFGEIEACLNLVNDRQADVHEVLAQANDLNDAYQETRDQQQELVAQQKSTQKQLATLREHRSASQARLMVLEDLEKRQEGVGIGVREILNRARESKQPPWSNILGSVADLLDVELENAALLEVALGNRAQLIVMDDIEPLVEYINEGSVRIDGRVGFLGLNAAAIFGDANGVQPVDLSHDPEVICRADSLLADSCEYTSLARQLLDSTWIVMTLDAARRLSNDHPESLQFVTLQGEVLESEGTVIVGTVRGETAVLSRKNELRRLKADVTKLDRSVIDNEKSLETVNNAISVIDDQLTETASQRDEMSDKLAQVKSAFESQQRTADRLNKEHASTLEQLIECDEKATSYEEQLKSFEVQLTDIQDQHEETIDGIQVVESKLGRLEEQRQEIADEETNEKLTLTRQEERRGNLLATCERLNSEATQFTEQLDENERRLNSIEERQRRTQLQLLNTNSSLAKWFIDKESESRRVDDLTGDKDELRQVRTKLGEEDARIRQERRDAADLHHSQEMQVREMRHQISSAGARIEEEYGMTLEQVVATDASAFRAFLIERGVLDDDATDDDAIEVADEDNSEDEESLDESDADEDDEEEDADEEEEDANEEEDLEEDEELETADEPSDFSDESEEDHEDEESLPITLQVIDGIAFADVRDELEEQVNRLRRKMKMMGNVNTESLNDLDEIETRFDHFNTQLMDLTEAKTTLEDIIRKINAESRRIFIESFESIRREFRELFRKLFGGGDGDIILEDPDDVLDCGIDIVARPPGKELRSISLLSGGEKTMTAVALLMAIFKSRPSPFCILDEVDAALDDANVERYAAVVREFRESTQFIVISHRKRTMVMADVIYGVTMEQSGVSKRMSVRFDDVSESGEFTAPEDSDDTAKAA
jgi:chromosome segregation protein